MLKNVSSIWLCYRTSGNGENKKKIIHHPNVLLLPTLSIVISIFYQLIIVVYRKSCFHFFFIFKLNKTDEVTKALDLAMR